MIKPTLKFNQKKKNNLTKPKDDSQKNKIYVFVRSFIFQMIS